MLTDYRINGQSLSGDGFRLLAGTTHYSSISPRIESVTVNGRNGVLIPDGPLCFDPPEITLKAISFGADCDLLMHRFYRLCRAAKTLTRTETDTETGWDRTMSTSAILTSCQPNGEEKPWSDHRCATAVFQLPDVYWQGEQWQETTLAATGGLLLAGGVSKASDKGYWTRWQGLPNASPSELFDTIPEGWLSDAPITTLVMRFGMATAVTVTDPASGTNLMWGGTRANGQPYLYLDVANRKAWTSSNAAAWSGGTDVTSGLDWTGEPLQVWPSAEAGDYRLTIKQSGSTDKVTCRFLQSWE